MSERETAIEAQDDSWETARETWIQAEVAPSETPTTTEAERASQHALGAEGVSYYQGIESHQANGIVPRLVDDARLALTRRLREGERSAAATVAAQPEPPGPPLEND